MLAVLLAETRSPTSGGALLIFMLCGDGIAIDGSSAHHDGTVDSVYLNHCLLSAVFAMVAGSTGMKVGVIAKFVREARFVRAPFGSSVCVLHDPGNVLIGHAGAAGF
jgi:hypothetical protein